MPPRAITQVCPQCAMPLVLPASFAGKTIACSRCGHAVLVSDPGAAALPITQPALPPHLQAAVVADGAAPLKLGKPSKAPRKRSCLASGCTTVVVAVLVLAAVGSLAVGAVYLVTWDNRPMMLDGMDSQQDGKPGRGNYTDASRKAITIDGVTVRIDKAQVGRVDFRSQGKVRQTTTPHYLIVNVNVKNKSRSAAVLYQSWYDHEFKDDQGHSEDVELQDENGRRWEVFVMPEADTVERHVKPEVSLATGDETIDSLIFELPEQYVDEPLPPLFLALPGAAVGSAGKYYRFQLPGPMIDRRER